MGEKRTSTPLKEIAPGLIVRKSNPGDRRDDPERPRPVKTAQRRAQAGAKALTYRGANPVQLYIDKGNSPGESRQNYGKKNYQTRIRAVLALISGKDEVSNKETWDYPWHNLSPTQLTAFRNLLARNIAEKINKPSYCNMLISALKGVLRQCYKAELLDYETLHRLLQIKCFSVPKDARAKRRGTVSAHTMDAIFRELPLHSPNTARDHLMLLLPYKLGLRCCEIAELDVSDYDKKGKTLHIKGKGGSYRFAQLDRQLCDAIDAWLGFRASRSGPLLTTLQPGCPLDFDRKIRHRRMSPHSISTTICAAAKKVGINEPFSAHDLRRTRITDLLLEGNDTLIVARMVGHKSPATTARYDCRDDDEIRKAFLRNQRRCNRALKRARKAANAKRKTKPKKT